MLKKGFTIGEYVSDGKSLGRGAFATVYLGKHNITKDIVAIKVVDAEELERRNQKLRDHLDSEISIMTRLSHPNIVKLYQVFPAMDEEYIYMILEYCNGGDFSEYLHKSGPLSESKAKFFMKQLAAGLEFLRAENIVHRDLKPQNLLIKEEGHMPILKIADFGFARFIEPQSVADTICGSPLYMAPEILEFRPYTAKADLWSVGAIFFQMVTGEPPFNVRNQFELLRRLKTTEVSFPTHLGLSSECLDLMKGLLTKDAEKRISYKDFFSHPFLATNDSNDSSLFDEAGADLWGSSGPLESPMRIGSKTSTDMIDSESLLGTSPTEGSVLKRAVSRNLDDAFSSVDTEDSFSDFTLIGGSSGGKNENISMEKLFIDQIEEKFLDAEAVARLAQNKSNQSPVEAIVLYIHTLKLLQELVCYTKNEITKNGLEDSPRLEKILSSMYKESRECLTNADYLRRNQVRASDKTYSAPKLMYEYALQMGLNAAVDEMLGNNTKSKWMYTNGHHILRQLHREATSEADKKVLQSYIEAFSFRLKKLRLMGSA